MHIQITLLLIVLSCADAFLYGIENDPDYQELVEMEQKLLNELAARQRGRRELPREKLCGRRFFSAVMAECENGCDTKTPKFVPPGAGLGSYCCNQSCTLKEIKDHCCPE